MPSLKLIITSKGNLKNKYGPKFKSVEKLFNRLIKADKKKDLQTAVVYIDDKNSARRFGWSATATITPRNCKQAIDKIYTGHHPAYLMIFGAQDIFPFQTFPNALYQPNNPDGDSDAEVFSDLPYACESPYSKTMTDFNNPTRVVGRLPDLPGKADLLYVQTLIGDSIRHQPRERRAYEKYFAVTAHVWTKSTRETLQHIFGNSDRLLDCPPDGTGYAKSTLAPLTHFYNCHGSEGYPQFYGQLRSNSSTFPVSVDAQRDIANKINYGTVVAAECCYGSQLLDPAERGNSMASHYLVNHALAFMGSSTIAYGMTEGQWSADLICQFFIQSVLAGASTGRAMLEARQQFLDAAKPYIDGPEQKTMAQFFLLGDPSLSLVKQEEKDDEFNTIANRRNNLFKKGVSLGHAVEPSQRIRSTVRSPKPTEVKKLLRDNGFSEKQTAMIFQTHAHKAGGSRNLHSKKILTGQVRFRTFMKGRKRADGIPDIQALVIKEDGKEILGWKLYVSR